MLPYASFSGWHSVAVWPRQEAVLLASALFRPFITMLLRMCWTASRRGTGVAQAVHVAGGLGLLPAGRDCGPPGQATKPPSSVATIAMLSVSHMAYVPRSVTQRSKSASMSRVAPHGQDHHLAGGCWHLSLLG